MPITRLEPIWVALAHAGTLYAYGGLGDALGYLSAVAMLIGCALWARTLWRRNDG